MFITVTLNPAIDKWVSVNKFVLGETNKCAIDRTDLSGKGINVSTVLATLGQASIATGFMSASRNTEYTTYLNALDIICDFTGIAGEIRSNIKLRESSGRETELNERGPIISAAEATAFIRSLSKYCMPGNIICISGSLPCGLPSDFYRQIILTAKKGGALTLFDSAGQAFKEGIDAIPYAVLPNLKEFTEYFGNSSITTKEIKENALKIIDKGVFAVVISMGKKGACFITKNHCIHARLNTEITVKGTIGAGDAITAAFALGLYDNLPLNKTAELCIAAASACCMETGTAAGKSENIKRLRETVITDEI